MTVRRLVKKGLSKGWLAEVSTVRRPNRSAKFANDSVKQSDTEKLLFIKRVSQKKILGLSSSPAPNLKGLCSKQILRDKQKLMTRAVLLHALAMQSEARGKLEYKIDRGKLTRKPIVGSKELLMRKRGKPIKVVSCTLPDKVFISDDCYTVGVSQRSIAKRIGMTLKQVSMYLKGTKHVQIYKQTSLSAAFDDEANTYVYANEDTEECKAYKPMPFVYLEEGVTYKSHRLAINKLRAKLKYRLTPELLKIAKLAAILKGLSYTDDSGYEYIAKHPQRFWNNTQRVLSGYRRSSTSH